LLCTACGQAGAPSFRARSPSRPARCPKIGAGNQHLDRAVRRA
jgi:hypothetical protein